MSELKRQSEDGKVPINDDSPTLHRLQETLELILLFGLIGMFFIYYSFSLNNTFDTF